MMGTDRFSTEKTLIENLFFDQFRDLTLHRNNRCSWQFMNYCRWTGVV